MPRKKKTITSPSHLAANARYDAKFEKKLLRMPPELKTIIEENLDGKSMNQYILDLIRDDLKKKGIELP